MTGVVDVWPLFGLRLIHEDLELRYVTDADAVALGSVAFSLLEPAQEHFMPRLVAGAVADTPELTARNIAQWVWKQRAEFTAAAWTIPLAVRLGGVTVGTQALHTKCFEVIRDVHTGSYLDRSCQGRGVGLRMRAIAVEFSFEYLGALTVSSGYAEANTASKKISERLGYEPDGVTFDEHAGERFVYPRVRLSRERWQEFRPGWLDELEVVGFDRVRELVESSPT